MKRVAISLLFLFAFQSPSFASKESFDRINRRVFSQSIALSSGSRAGLVIIESSGSKGRVDAAASRALSVIQAIDRDLGDYPNNLTARINALRAGEKLALPPKYYQLFKRARDLSVATSGWFDIAAPSKKSAFSQRDYRRISLNDADRTISFTKNKMQLDVRWIARALGVDEAIASLKRDGITDAQVSVGGVSRNIGNDIHTPWAMTLEVPDGASRERYAHRAFRYNLSNVASTTIDPTLVGQQPLIDPKSKKSVKPEALRVTVIANDSVIASAFAVAIYSLPTLTGIRYLNKFPAVEGFVFDRDEGLFISDGLLAAPRMTDDLLARPKLPDMGPRDVKQKRTEEAKEL